MVLVDDARRCPSRACRARRAKPRLRACRGTGPRRGTPRAATTARPAWRRQASTTASGRSASTSSSRRAQAELEAHAGALRGEPLVVVDAARGSRRRAAARAGAPCRRPRAPTPNTVTSWPRAAATQAASMPAMPAPTTTTRRRVCGAWRATSRARPVRPTRGLLSQASVPPPTMVPQQVLQETQ